MKNQMYVFRDTGVYEDAMEITDSYHAYGSLIVIAKDLKEAKALLKTGYKVSSYSDERFFPKADFRKAEKYLTNAPTGVWVFPDAGCC